MGIITLGVVNSGVISSGVISSLSSPAIERVVTIGASIMHACYGQSLVTPSAEGTQAFVDAGIIDVDVFGYCFPGENMVDLLPRIATALATFDPLTTLYVYHGTGNSVTEARPYPSMTQQEKDDFSDQLDDVFTAFAGTNFIITDATFRAYDDPAGVFGRDIYNDGEFGSEPYNREFNHPKIAVQQPQYTNTDGASIVDWLNHVRNDFVNILGVDGIHPTVPYGTDSLRAFLPTRVGYLINGGSKPAILIPAVKDNIDGIEAKATISLGFRDSTLQNSANVDSLKVGQRKYLKDDAGVYTPYIYSMTTTDTLNTGNNVNGGATVGVPVYAGDIYCDQMITDSCFAASTVTVTHMIEGLTPLTAYAFETVANRQSGSARSTLIDFGDTSSTIDTSALVPELAKLNTSTSDAGGIITFTQTATVGTFNYLGAVSIEEVVSNPELVTNNDLTDFDMYATGVTIDTPTAFTTTTTGRGIVWDMDLVDGTDYRIEVTGTSDGGFSINTADANVPTARTEILTGFGVVFITAHAGKPKLYLRNATAGTTSSMYVSVKEVT